MCTMAVDSLPGLDCGACGFRTCATFAEALPARPELLERCIYLAAEATRQTAVSAPVLPLTLFGKPFLTWRGIPLIPTDKIHVKSADNKTKILLLRSGARKQGCTGLFQPGLAGKVSPGLPVRFMGIDTNALAAALPRIQTARPGRGV